MSRQNLTCPKCSKKLKSNPGYTLHIKKCCPEMRFVQTTVKLEIEMVVPRDVSNATPMNLFRSNWGPYDKKDGGTAKVTSVTIRDEPTVTPRQPKPHEKARMAKAEKNKGKTATVAELKKIVNAALEEKWHLKVNTRWVYYTRPGHPRQQHGHWPDFVKITAGKPGQMDWMEFVFDLKKETVVVSHARGTKKEVRLADPKLFESIRRIRG